MERLKRRTDFRAAAHGIRAPGKSFVLQARRRADDGVVRVGLTVSRQVGNAVERNRVRRRLREVVRLAPAGTLHAGHDYVLIARRAALALTFGEMIRELNAALRRIHVPDHGRREDGAGTGGSREQSLHEAGSPASTRSKPPRPPRQKPAMHEH